MSKNKRKNFSQVFISKFLISLPIAAIVFIITFAYLDYYSESALNHENIVQAESKTDIISDVLNENTLEEKKEKIRYLLGIYQSTTTFVTPGSSSIAYIEDSEGNIVLDSSKRLFLLIVPKIEDRDTKEVQFFSCDLEYLQSHPELSALIETDREYNSDTVLEFITPRSVTYAYPTLLDAYADSETGKLYLGNIVMPYTKCIMFMGGETDYGAQFDTINENVVHKEYFDLTPEDVTGYLKYTSDEDNLERYFDGDKVSGFTIFLGGYENADKVRSKTSAFDHTSHIERTVTDINGDTYTIHFVYNNKFFRAYFSILLIIALIYLFIDIIICLILSKISYEKLKGFYRNEDYRKALMSSMAHDLKTPLTVMSGYAQNLKENVQSEKREHYADAILQNTEYMNGIIVDILSLSKLEENGNSSSKEKTDFCEIAKELQSKFEPAFSEKNITLSVNGSFNRKVNRASLTRVLDNLINNAYKYTKENGDIRIYAKDKPFSRHVFIIENSPAEPFSVKPEKLWEPFVKGDESRSENNGTGLGLSIVRNILENQGFKSKIKYKDNTFRVIIK